ncbi:MAG: Ankyrin [Acidobacteria bacterium]|nr:Ankyrin [Acidobacteriota bacterium]
MRHMFLVMAVALLTACFYARARDEQSSLVGAVREGDVSQVRALLARGADPNQPEGVNGWTPLLHAVHKNQAGSVQALLDGHADVNRAAPNGATPLMMAAGYGYTPVVELLLRRGADPRLAGPDHDRPLDWALTGVTDTDRWTYFQCQTPTVRALLVAHPDLRHTASPSALRWAGWKHCKEELALVR